jgi:hypothetical protein
MKEFSQCVGFNLKAFQGGLADQLVRAYVLVGGQRLSCKSFFCYYADLQCPAVADFEYNRDHSSVGEVNVIQSLSRFVEVFVVLSFDEFKVRTDQVVFGIGNLREDKIFYARSSGIGSLEILSGRSFPRGYVRLIGQFSNASFCEVTICLMRACLASIVLLNPIFLWKIPETGYTKPCNILGSSANQVGWLAKGVKRPLFANSTKGAKS